MSAANGRSAANGHGACESGASTNNGNSNLNGGCLRPDCIYGLTRCGWHVQA